MAVNGMAVKKLKLGVLISGRGSNLQALIDACRDPDFPAVVGLVISNIADAGGLEKARNAGIRTHVIDHTAYKARVNFDFAVSSLLKDQKIDVICLAGFMRILSPDFINQWPGRIINIHPSLLPDYKGLDTHARVLQDGRAETGCTVHIVTAALDDGPILIQKRVPVMPGDTLDSLTARVLEQEHQAYPEAVRLLAAYL